MYILYVHYIHCIHDICKLYTLYALYTSYNPTASHRRPVLTILNNYTRETLHKGVTASRKLRYNKRSVFL